MTHPEFVAEANRILSPGEWRTLCDRLKAENNGFYPTWWFPKIIQSGFADMILRNCGSDAEIRVKFF
jgi:hypothetical protein